LPLYDIFRLIEKRAKLKAIKMSEVHPLRQKPKGFFEEKLGVSALLLCVLAVMVTGTTWS